MDVARLVQEQLSGWRQLHAARSSIKQAYPELLLKLLDLSCQRRLGNMQAGRGAANVGLFRDGDEITQVAKVHVRAPGVADQYGLNHTLEVSSRWTNGIGR